MAAIFLAQLPLLLATEFLATLMTGLIPSLARKLEFALVVCPVPEDPPHPDGPLSPPHQPLPVPDHLRRDVHRHHLAGLHVHGEACLQVPLPHLPDPPDPVTPAVDLDPRCVDGDADRVVRRDEGLAQIETQAVDPPVDVGVVWGLQPSTNLEREWTNPSVWL